MALTPNQIKGIIVTNGDTIKGLAYRFSSPVKQYCREDVSRVINRLRSNNDLEQKIADYIGKPVEEVFGPDTQAKAA